MSTLKDIAEKCNLSVSTVSLAIHKPYKISYEVRKKIYSVISETGYKKTDRVIVKNIGIYVQDLSKYLENEYYGDVVAGIFQAASDKRLSVKLFQDLNVDYSEVYGLQGLLLVGKTPDEQYVLAEQFKIPVVNCGHPSRTFPHISTICHERRSSTKHLIDFVLSCGHINVAAIIGDAPNDIIQKEFIEIIENTVPGFNKKQIFQADYENIQTVEILFNQIISAVPKVTAVLCVNDLIAYNVYYYASKYGVRIPEALSITGFDGISFPRYLKAPNPVLTTVMGDRRQLGCQAVEVLINKIKNCVESSSSVYLPSYLSIGESVARI